MQVFYGLMLPFIGTLLGSACVFFVRKSIGNTVQRSLAGFAAGVMVAASIWSLIIPAMNQSEHLGKFAFIPAAVGFWLGVLFLLILDHIIPHIHIDSEKPEGVKTSFAKNTMMFLAITLHNIPEGMAIGVVYASVMSGESDITILAALALSVGIAIQNFPEGAIVSLPLASNGVKKSRSFALGAASGIVEPIFAGLTILLSHFIVPALPYLLSFAAGSMMYVVVEELIPEISHGKHSHAGTLFFALGFSIMMILDVALG